MAPVCLSACRQLLPVRSVSYLCYLFVFSLLFLWRYSDAALWTYDRQTLMRIKSAQESQTLECPPAPHNRRHPRFIHPSSTLPPFNRRHPRFIHPSADCIHQLPCCAGYRKKRRRNRGNRGGIRVRIRREISCSPAQPRTRQLSTVYAGHSDLYLARRSWDPRYSCHLSVAPFRTQIPASPARPRLRVRSGGVNLQNIRPLELTRCQQVSVFSAKAALINCRSVSNKTFILNDFFTGHDLDLLFLTETWITSGPGELSAFGELCPTNCSVISTPRCVGRGGGVALVFKNRLKIRTLSTGNYSSFELQCVKIESTTTPLVCALVYRPPKPDKDFISDFSDFLSQFVPLHDRLLILGDFNIHVCCPGRPMVSEFCHVLDSFSLLQHIDKATHVLGHSLDLILSYGIFIDKLNIEDASFSDHMPIVFDITLSNPMCTVKTPGRFSRYINSHTAIQFSEMFKKTAFSTADRLPSNPDELISLFHSSCSDILNSVAPLKYRRPKLTSQQWLDEPTRSFRQACRKAERRWKKDHLTVSFDIFKNALLTYQAAAKKARTKHFSDIINKNSHRPQILFGTINSIINPHVSPDADASTDICEKFLKFFTEKIENIRSQFNPSPSDITPGCSGATVIFNTFKQVSLEELREIVSHMKPTSSPHDVVPSHIIKDTFDTVGPSIQNIINSCLVSGTVPSCFKHAVVQPLLKKHNLDAKCLKNYRPISKLPFISKVMEKVVLSQLQPFLDLNEISEPLQSGFKTLHSTETALLKVTNDLLLTLDSGENAILVLLDLSAAFDTVDHNTLLTRLEQWVGIKGTALDWFSSYLKHRTFSVSISQFFSSTAPVSYGVPQGSILGPVLFGLYMLPLGNIIRKHNISFHLYADDSQLYLPLKSKDSLQPLLDCLDDIKGWMATNFLQLNSNKTEVMIFGPPKSKHTLVSNLDNLEPFVKSHARNLGVILDSELCLDKQICAAVKNCFYQLRVIAKIKPFLSPKDLEKIIHAFITSRLDYCNSLYIGLPQSLLNRLQMAQNAAARLLTGTKKHDHITPVLASLHWLPVNFRIQFKVLLIVFKALNGQAPSYISDLIHPHQAPRSLRSSGNALLHVPRSRLKRKGDRAFAVAAPRLWNQLPLDIKKAPSILVFKSRLKTHLFTLSFPAS